MANTSAKPRDESALKTSGDNVDRANLTPMMAQYMQIKDAHPDCLLFYRMGDFYELFFEDAVQASAALDITLTRRGKNGGVDIPMCGVPVHSHESYLSRLIRYGFRVAICEQVETPDEAKQRAVKEGMPKSKVLVKRDVVRVITPGTLTEDSLLDTRAHNYLCAVAETSGDIGLSWLDMSTGDFTLQAVSFNQLSAALERLDPSELLIPEKLQQSESLFETWADYREELTIQPNSRFDSENARKRLEELFGVGTLEGFGGFSRAEIAAAGALIDYAELTQKGRLPRINPPRQLAAGQVMEIDAATRKNLELTRTLSGERKGSLLSTIDMTVTAAGARLLGEHLAIPLTDVDAINNRLDMVDYYLDHATLRGDCREALKQCPDIERALGRLSLGRGGPRDLAAIRDGLLQANAMRRILLAGDNALNMLPDGIADALKRMDNTGVHSPLTDRLDRALQDDLPLLARDGGFIRKGYSDTLDEFRSLRDDSRKLIAGLQKDYAEKTGVSSLKIKHNNVIGYHVEVTASHGDKLMDETSGFIHRQTLANSVRFTTVELSGLERKISEAADRALALEQEIFAQLVSDVLAHDATIAATARALAELDVAAASAELSARNGYCRPQVDHSLSFEISSGRHPVVEAALKAQEGQDFIPNDCDLGDAGRLWLLTGPNMAGKSTFLRQNALIALMAQMGCHVPAQKAHIGVVDRLFSRVGAADDLARGRSTFMVEMVETAAILNQAGPRSLVILDEIGRGTATFDGLSIAWACVEHLHDANKCRGLFATHYHELTSLTARLDKLSCHTMRVKEWKGDVVFMHEVGDGTADRSYGIHVARLAGLPRPVIIRAEDVLKNLEEGEQSGSLAKLADDLPLFSHTMSDAGQETSPPAGLKNTPGHAAALTRLAEINPDDMTPREALDVLYNLKTLSEGDCA